MDDNIIGCLKDFEGFSHLPAIILKKEKFINNSFTDVFVSLVSLDKQGRRREVTWNKIEFGMNITVYSKKHEKTLLQFHAYNHEHNLALSWLQIIQLHHLGIVLNNLSLEHTFTTYLPLLNQLYSNMLEREVL